MASSGWDARELSEKTKIKFESIRKWETSSVSIKVSDLRKVSKAIKRPLSVLLLPEPPKERQVLGDVHVISDYVSALAPRTPKGETPDRLQERWLN